MKKYTISLLFILIFIVSACTEIPITSDPTIIEDYICKDNPLGEGCYIPAEDLNHISPIPQEYLISETFDSENVGSMPRNWLLYRNEEYAINGVRTIIGEEDGGNRFVRMYSDGRNTPPYPQSTNITKPSFIFTTKFNLDIDRKGVAYASIMIPEEETSSGVNVGVATGAVNVIGVQIGSNMAVTIRVGGPFFYYSGNGDGGDIYNTSLTLTKGIWYRFKFIWDANENMVAAYHLDGENEILLHTDEFHISNRVNAIASGEIMVPNVVRVTMMQNLPGWAYLDDVIVERKGE
jgi:hypothetical protein